MSTNRAPQPGDTVHFIDHGDPAHLDATVIATHPKCTDDNIVDLRIDQSALGVLRDVEYDEGEGEGYWHWPSAAPLYTVAYEVQDREEFRAMLGRLGIDSHVVPDGGGRTTIALDRDGMEQLRTWFADHGDTAQADAIQRALDE